MLFAGLLRVLKNPWRAGAGTWLFLLARWCLTPYTRAGRFVPRSGKILDLGCGHGLFSIHLAGEAPAREVLALDHDPRRLALAETAARAFANCRVAPGTMREGWEGPFRAIIVFDALHYLPPAEQQALITRAFEALEPGGVLLAREVEPQSGASSRFNQWYEKIATSIGFTKSQSTELYFRNKREWVSLLERAGFSVYATPCSSFLFSDILFVAKKPGESARATTLPWLTADDWGMSPAVNRGILTLAQRGIVKRVSLMAKAPHARYLLEELLQVPGVKLGLHWDLTSHLPSPLDVFFLGENPRIALEEQLEILESWEVPVSYVDSHQHVHVLPGKLEAVADILKGRGISQVRLPYDSELWFTRKFPVNVMSLLVAGAMKRHGFESLDFRYPQRKHFEDTEKLKSLLARHPDAEVIVHPAEADDFESVGCRDPYRAERVLEFHALSGLA